MERRDDVRENRETGYEENLAITMRQCTLDDSDDETTVALLLVVSSQEGRASGVLEDFPNTFASPC
jgi:hypothetical protein